MAKKARRPFPQENELFLHSILDHIPDMIFIKDAKTLRFVLLNKAGEKLLGRKQKDLIGKNDYDFFPKKEADFFTRKDRSVLRKKRLLDIPEEPIHSGTKGIRILHTKKIPLLRTSGQNRYLLGISEDITERKNAEEALHKTYAELETRVRDRTAELSSMNRALQDSKERYRMVLSALLEGVVVIDAAGKVLSVNPGAEKILGFKERDMLGRTAFDPTWGVLHEENAHDKPENFFITASLRTGKPFANAIIGLRRAGGQLVWLNGNTQPLFAPGTKKPYAVVISFFDITRRKSMEAEIQKLNSELEQKVEQRTSELKLAVDELESFSYSVSHDLRAPLRAIEGFSAILLEDHGSQLNEEGKRLLQEVRKNTLHMSQLIDDLLAFSRISRKDLIKKRVPMADVARLVEEDLIKDDLKNEVRLQSLPDAYGDAALLRQVWTNLLSNALKFTRGTAIPQIEVGFNQAPSETIYFVRDNGVGFDMEYAGRLFGVFQRLHSAQEFEGTGVGLAIVQRIINKHGGRVWAEGQVNKGATFYFSLPKMDAPR